MLEWSGALDDAPADFKAGVVQYMQVRQDPDSGFFRDPQHIDQYSEMTLDRAAGMAQGVLRKCGAEPLYPMPQERAKDNAEAATHYAHLESPETFRAWLEALSWDTKVWTAGSRIRAQSGVIDGLPEPKRSELLDVAEIVLAEQQNADGTFGTVDNPWYARLSGSYKTASFLEQCGRQVPRSQELADTIVRWLNEAPYDNSIVVYNTAKALNILQHSGVEFTLDERLAIVDRCVEILETMKGPDGGYVTIVGRPTPVEIGKRMGLDVIESNTNATGLVHSTRSYLIEFLTGEPGPHPHPASEELLLVLKR